MLLDYVSTQKKKSKKLVGVTNRMKSLNDGTRNIHYKWLRVMNGWNVVGPWKNEVIESDERDAKLMIMASCPAQKLVQKVSKLGVLYSQ